jgi:hypothetical protein
VSNYSTGARPSGEKHAMKDGEPKEAPLRKDEINQLIWMAADGDQEAARRLVSPFVSKGETLINFGLSAKFGIFPTYDFFFLTERQVGDLQVTPLTGDLDVETAYLRNISAMVLRQPAISIMFRMFMWSVYVWLPFALYSIASLLFGALIGNAFGSFLSVLCGIAGLPLAYFAFNPSLVRAYLHFRKSGLYLILTASQMGVLIFADRNKFELMSRLTRQVSELKRKIDAGAN